MQRRLALIIGVVLSLVAIFMIKLYTDQQKGLYQQAAAKQLAQERASQSAVLVAKQDLPKGSFIDNTMLEVAIIPNQYVQPNAVDSLDRIAGMVAAVPIAKGEQISLSKLTSSQQATGGSLAMVTPIGKRAVSISVDNIASLAGMVRPGDYVDVVGMIPTAMDPTGKEVKQVSMMPLFQNVLILAVGQDLGGIAQEAGGRYKKEEPRAPSPIVTLALSPQEASLIAFVQEQGKIRLILRSPADSQITLVAPANWDTLLMYLTPRDALNKAQPAEKPKKTVEIYRGLQKEVVPLSR